MKQTKHYASTILAFSFWLGCAQASDLEVHVIDKNGENLQDAIVLVVTKDGVPIEANEHEKITIDQQDKEFIPFMTALSVGSSVVFPNNDNIRHQVYSFSEAKKFEIPLYKGAPENPVDFDKFGVVALGCNIHDWMKAYIYVAKSPHYAVTDQQGVAVLENLPKGKLEVQVWHPRLKGEAESTTQIVAFNDISSLTFSLDTKKIWRAFRSPSNSGSGGYK